VLDFGQPIAVMLLGITQGIPDLAIYAGVGRKP
jgi:hypothetical protein